MLGVPRASAEQPLAETPAEPSHGHHHRHHHKRRSRKSKNQHSTSVQFPESESTSEPSWVTTENVNIESLLPSHTIQVKRKSEDLPKSVNSASEQEFARSVPKCSTPDKVCDVSPLENLLAVAELELKQHMQSGNWNSSPEESSSKQPDNQLTEKNDGLLQTEEAQEDNEHHEQKSQECSYNDDDEMSMNDILSRLEQSLQSPHGFGSENGFDDDILDESCKFNTFPEQNNKSLVDESAPSPEKCNNYNLEIKEEDNEYAETYGDDLETQTSKSLKSPDTKETSTPEEPNLTEHLESSDYIECQTENIEHTEEGTTQKTMPPDCENISESNGTSEDSDNHSPVTKEPETLEIPTITKQETEPNMESNDTPNDPEEPESTTIQNEEPSKYKQEPPPEEEPAVCLDLSIKSKANIPLDQTKELHIIAEHDDGPTDLCIRKSGQLARPPSQNSEAIQSPQPSGIPAVPASPDIVSTSTAIGKPRSAFLESLLATSALKANNVDRMNSKEPLDLGQCRKSASPTVTCSEEIVTPSVESEPPMKKLKSDDITLKNLLDKDIEMLDQSIKKPTHKDLPVLPDTPRLLSILKASNETLDPLAEYKQLLLEIDVPNPLMVPKDVFPDLLKHPRREVLKILSGHSNKNVALDDILVVYKDKLMAAIESSQNSSSSLTRQSEVKILSKPAVNKSSEQNNNEKLSSQHSTKRKSSDTNKNISASPERKNSLANDIDAANEAAFNPLFWAGCPNPFEAMANYSNHNEFIQALYAASSIPYLPGQLGELHPGIQMMLGNKMTSPLGFPPLPHVNLNNPFELSMWQEAMMQANLLKNKSAYENAGVNHASHRPSLQKKNQIQHNQVNSYKPRVSNGHTKNLPQPPQIQQQSMLHPALHQTALTNSSSWQNPYLGLGNFPPFGNNLVLDTSQFNPFSHKNNISPTSKQSQQLSPPILHKKNMEANLLSQYNEQEKRLHQQMMQEHQKIQQMQQQKLIRQQQHQHLLHQQQQQQQHQQQQQQQQQQMQRQNNGAKFLPPLGKKTNFPKDFVQEKSHFEMQKHLPVPMDLSGAQSQLSKKPGKTNGMVTSSKNIMDDVPEVGSTTGSIEDMQESHAHLWHPLFGSQNKGYNPWNIPSLAAIGE